MKWGRKKSSPPSLITRVLPVSWLSKFKQKGGNPETGSGKKQQRGKLDFPTPSSGWREAIFYSVDDDDDDAYWRLSFLEEGGEGRRRKGGTNPLWFDSDDEFQIPKSSKEMEFSRVHRSISDMVLDIEKKMKKKQNREKIQVKTESGSISRRSHRRKVKQADSRIRVLEDKKRGRKKLKKKTRKEQSVEFSSFAVVKSSFDPQLDFKDSMVEMIRFKGIRRPEELEELLAAYLTLNPDKFHDLIIKAFQQVWLHLRDAIYPS